MSSISERSTVDEIQSDEENGALGFVCSFCKLLEHQVIKKEFAEEESKKFKCFNSKQVPMISIEDYVRRIVQYSEIEVSTLATSLMYIHRLCSNSKIKLTSFNVHKIVFVSIFLSIKFNEDEHFKIDYYSQVAGMSVEEIMILELEFFKLVNFNLFIEEEEFGKYLSLLEK